MQFEVNNMGNIEFEFISFDSKPVSKELEIEASKMFSRVFSQATKNTKRDKCYHCERICTSFCNSHSIPMFALERIAQNGKVTSFLENALFPSKENRGVKNTGTFQIICNECDSKVFHDYENPNGYKDMPSNAMLSQIALKNYLHLIWKRTSENEFYRLLKKEGLPFAEEKIFWGEMDFDFYSKEYVYAKKSLEKNDDGYYICFFRHLDYVIPYAAQAAITLIGDLEDNLINDIYNTDIGYKTSEIHVMALPLKETSVVLAFIKNGDKNYRKFYKQLHRLPIEDQLSTINYILFNNTENIFVNPVIAKILFDNKAFQSICRQTSDYTTDIFSCDINPIKQAIEKFSLSQRKLIPNLLSKDFAL